MPQVSDTGPDGFRFGAGRACLDLTATMGQRWGRQIERLRATDHLANWFVEAGLAAVPPVVSRQDLAHVRTLREAIHQTITRRLAVQPPGPGDLAIINDWAGRPQPRVWLEAGDDGRISSRRDAATAAILIADLARDAVDLLGGRLADRIRACSAEDCALIFLDTSRAGRRRWCSMAACGARAKMAAYRARRVDAAQ